MDVWFQEGRHGLGCLVLPRILRLHIYRRQHQALCPGSKDKDLTTPCMANNVKESLPVSLGNVRRWLPDSWWVVLPMRWLSSTVGKQAPCEGEIWRYTYYTFFLSPSCGEEERGKREGRFGCGIAAPGIFIYLTHFEKGGLSWWKLFYPVLFWDLRPSQ